MKDKTQHECSWWVAGDVVEPFTSKGELFQEWGSQDHPFISSLLETQRKESKEGGRLRVQCGVKIPPGWVLNSNSAFQVTCICVSINKNVQTRPLPQSSQC